MNECAGAELAQVVQLVSEARASEAGRSDRRVEQRYTYFRPLAVKFETASGLKSVSGFNRDISLSGIGLLFGSAVEHKRCSLQITDESGAAVSIPAEVMWCRPCGEGWFLAGARFLRD